MEYSFKDSDLTSEKSLWDVYKLSRRILPSKFQVSIVITVTVLLALNSFMLTDDNSVLLQDVRKWAEMGFNFSITTLGFLIAGFTIFATLSKPKMMLAMMDHINKETGLPTLKYNFFAFMKVFIAYILFSFLFLTIVLFGQKDGFLGNAIELLPHSDCIKSILIKTFYAIVGGSFVYLLLLLKSFVYNIYAIVMNFLRWEYYQE
ncbi:MAG: hypothetical protein J7D61_13180 [Marichromatium sp.]|nr:hypothetical protein [Marichromatium sp.]